MLESDRLEGKFYSTALITNLWVQYIFQIVADIYAYLSLFFKFIIVRSCLQARRASIYGSLPKTSRGNPAPRNLIDLTKKPSHYDRFDYEQSFIIKWGQNVALL